MAVGELAMAMTDLGMVHQLPGVVSLKKMAPTVSSPGPSAYQAHVITIIPDHVRKRCSKVTNGIKHFFLLLTPTL